MGAMTPPSRKSCYNFRVIEINRVLDGDTIDVTIDLGFDLYKKERVRVAGVDTPEKRTRDLEEKDPGIHATNCLKKNSKGRFLVMMILLSVLNSLVALGSMVVFHLVIHWGRRCVAQRNDDCRRICMGI